MGRRGVRDNAMATFGDGAGVPPIGDVPRGSDLDVTSWMCLSTLPPGCEIRFFFLRQFFFQDFLAIGKNGFCFENLLYCIIHASRYHYYYHICSFVKLILPVSEHCS